MNQNMITPTQNHQKNHKQWTIQDDLHLLKNWKKEDHTIGTELSRTTLAIQSRRSYLRNHDKRVKIISTTFPNAQLEQIEAPIERSKRSIHTKSGGTTYNNFHIPSEIIEKYQGNIATHKNSYSLKDLLFLATHLDKKDSWNATQTGRTVDAISVIKTKIKRAIAQGSSNFLFNALQDLKGTKVPQIVKQPRNVKLATNTTISEKSSRIFVVNFTSFEVDQKNKQIVFKIN